MKYLRIIIDQSLKWDSHIRTIIIKLRKLLNIQTLRYDIFCYDLVDFSI